MRLLLFGSRDWVSPVPVGALLDVVAPSLVVHGACGLDEDDPIDPDWMRGADGHAHREAVARGIATDPYPAAWKRLGRAAGMQRTARQYREGRPDVAAGWITGKVGAPTSPGSAGMARICRDGLREGRGSSARRVAPPVPVVVYREDGVELPPHGTVRVALESALGVVRALYRTCPEVEPAGSALRVAWDAERARANIREVLALVRGARGEVEKLVAERPQIGPWLGVVAGVLRVW